MLLNIFTGKPQTGWEVLEINSKHWKMDFLDGLALFNVDLVLYCSEVFLRIGRRQGTIRLIEILS